MAPINPDGTNAPMCRAPDCHSRATRRSYDMPPEWHMEWCEDCAGPSL